MKDILEFQGEHRWLSNFHPVDVSVDFVIYPSVEHAYQAAKTLREEERAPFRYGTAAAAKRNGRKVTMREDWDDVKLLVMHGLLRQKFFRGTALADKLLQTDDAKIVEGNYWNDTFWGVCRGRGENHLGRLIMEVREELR